MVTRWHYPWPRGSQTPRTKRPVAPLFVDLERARPHISSNTIIISMLNEALRSIIYTVSGVNPYGVYGTTRYGRCRYGARYGIYGYDNYGSCRYAAEGYARYGRNEYGGCRYG